MPLLAGSRIGAAGDGGNPIARTPPSNPAARQSYERGRQFQEAGRPREAIVEYDRAIAAEPDFTQAHKARASARRSVGDRGGALADLDRVHSLDAREFCDAHWDRGACHRRASVLLLLKCFQEAEVELDVLEVTAV